MYDPGSASAVLTISEKGGKQPHGETRLICTIKDESNYGCPPRCRIKTGAFMPPAGSLGRLKTLANGHLGGINSMFEFPAPGCKNPRAAPNKQNSLEREERERERESLHSNIA